MILCDRWYFSSLFKKKHCESKILPKSSQLADRKIYLEVKVQDNNHFPITWLEQSVLDVIVQNIHFVSSDRREAKTWVGRGWGRKQLSIKVYHQVNPKSTASFLADLNRVRGNANKVQSFPFCLATQYVKVDSSQHVLLCYLVCHYYRCATKDKAQAHERLSIPLTWASSEPCILFWAMFGRMYRSFSLGLLRFRLITSESCFTMP